MAETQPVPKDPIQTRSLSVPIFLATAIMMASVVYACFDEFVVRRPYKKYQADGLNVYLNYLDERIPEQQRKLAEVMDTDRYTELEAQLAAETERMERETPPISEKIEVIAANITALQNAQRSPKSLKASLIYKLETARTDIARQAIQAEIDNLKKEEIAVEVMENDEPVTLNLTLDGIAAKTGEYQLAKAELDASRAGLAKGVSAVSNEMNAYIAKELDGLTPDALQKVFEKAQAGMIGAEGKSVGEIMQIHVGQMGWQMEWIDRCESCHINAREPVAMSAEDLLETTEDGLTEDLAVLYAAHPNKELMDIHDPGQFGCSMCHNGNGISVSRVDLAHGTNKHWLYPLYHRENFEAGCVQCHTDDLQLDHATTFNEGRWQFYWRGCWGCHAYEGMDTQPAELIAVENERKSIETKLEKLEVKRKLEKEPLAKQKITFEQSSLTTRYDELAAKAADLRLERQRVGPNLKNLGRKIQPEWLVPWLLDPTQFRPDTKMPSFFENLPDEATKLAHARKIAAYLYQSSQDYLNEPANGVAALGQYKPGDVNRGKDLFAKKGCLGCHQIEEDGKLLGDGFAANLSRIGDKNDYDFVVQWVLEPDNGVMPNLYLSVEEAEHIATYLMSKKTNPNYPAEPALSDTALAEEGLALVRHYGCAGCHEIPGLETEGRIGVELTYEGSKPKERLDFGRWEHKYKMEGKYKHKYFFETKLDWPGKFGVGKVFQSDLDRLKMPNFRLDDDEVNSLTTFLLGSIDSEIPDSFKYNPGERGKAIQDGWWVVKKYNCVGCHQVQPGVEPALWKDEWFASTSEDGAERKPPSLVGIGFRSDPDWLAAFLRNPALNDHDTSKNALRAYLDIRMPQFRMSENEIQSLVRFFGALDSQPVPYIAPDLEPLTDQELGMARALFKSIKCATCHGGTPELDRTMSAPYLYEAAKKLKPAWTMRWLLEPLKMMPGTKMPQNFVKEYRVTTDEGSFTGTDYVVRGAKARMKLSSGESKSFDLAKVKDVQYLRTVGTDIPDVLKDYTGDHRDLIMRYMHLHYDKSEVERSQP